MSNVNLVRSISTEKCPSCDKKIYVSFLHAQPAITSVLTEEMVHDAKEDLKKRLDSIEMDEKMKTDYIEQLDQEDTILAPEDVEGVVKNLLEALGAQKEASDISSIVSSAAEDIAEIVKEESSEEVKSE